MKRSAFELGACTRTLLTKARSKRGDLYATLRDYPQRVVPLGTAYNRMITRPDVSLHDACTVRGKLPRLPRSKTLESKWDPEYKIDLESGMKYSAVAAKWEINPSTVLKHRQILRGER